MASVTKEVNGYAGKLLRVFLDGKKTKEGNLNFNDLKKYIGGVGYGAKLLYDEVLVKWLWEI